MPTPRHAASTTWLHTHIARLNTLTTIAQTADAALQQGLRDFATQLIHTAVRPPTGLVQAVTDLLFDLPKIARPNSDYARFRTQQQQNHQAQVSAQHTCDEDNARALLTKVPTLKVDDLHQLIAALLQKTSIATLRQHYIPPPKYREVSPRE